CLALGSTPLEALHESVRASDFAKTIFVDGEVLAIYGVVSQGATLLTARDHACVWMLSGTAVEKHKKLFLRASRAVVQTLLRDYRSLSNVVDARYEKAIRWAKWLGFEVGDPTPLGPQGEMFRPIEIRSSTWA